MKSRLAKSARIHRKGIDVDGEPFPFYIAENGISLKPSMSGITVVTLDVIVDGPVLIGEYDEADPAEWTPFDGTPEPDEVER